jgi:cytochrome c-type biogenesis protein CcmH
MEMGVISRRNAVQRLATMVVASGVGAQVIGAQAQGAANIEMPQSAYIPVRKPNKPDAKVLLVQEERDALERGLKCACPCKLDVFTCRTTDFSCGISPAMHSDVVRLIKGGYSADEIVAAFKEVYGERVLMTPEKTGFNLTGYFLPGVVVGLGAMSLMVLLRKWRTATPAVVAPASDMAPVAGASADELERLDAAIRNPDRR